MIVFLFNLITFSFEFPLSLKCDVHLPADVKHCDFGVCQSAIFHVMQYIAMYILNKLE